MNKPRILITTSNISSPKLGSITGDTDLIYSDTISAQAVIKSGGMPVYMPAIAVLTEEDLKAYLETVDGVLFTGADTEVNPVYYDEKTTHQKGRVDDEKDKVDLLLARLAYANKLPMLGICKGMQLINVALGGSLYQDVTAQHAGRVTHALRGKRSQITHDAQLAEGSLLKHIFKQQKVGLNGGHDQAIKTLANALHPAAMADDGIVEAYEGKDYPFLVGVQFHIELRAEEPQIAGLLRSFVNACLKV
ncbi:MAG TPA: gamma-glutamyl-gamma-aminobutyrate hydrolase family protein [Candidatus Saccharimonadales bacterium]|nr:gamma-glutamyl-gamma-aminobutyrate hydrolase family protein [Candidatus Saccharimonadales bacterium]